MANSSSPIWSLSPSLITTIVTKKLSFDFFKYAQNPRPIPETDVQNVRTASTLHNHHRAKFIGEEAAGGHYGNTSGPGALLVLPNSKLRLPLRLMTYYMAMEGNQYGNRSIRADYPLSYSIEELLAGKDKEMDRALQLISQQEP